MEENCLYYGDNLEILRKHIKSDSIDLIYLDPPFNSQADYNILFKEASASDSGGGRGEKSKAQIQAFTDSWTWDIDAQKTFEYLTLSKEVPAKITELINSLEHLLGKNSMSAYLVMMTVRLIEMRRVLKPTGSIYLHCDPTASHYLKLVLDSVFGVYNFRNEIIWKRTVNPKGSQYESKKFGKAHDTIFFYTKSNNFIFNLDEAKVSLTDIEIQAKYYLRDEKGSYYVGPIVRSQSMGERPNLVYEYKGYTPDSSGWRMTKEKLTELDEAGNLGWSSTGKPYRKLRPSEKEGKYQLKRSHRWLKAHVCVGVKTNIITSAKITDEFGADSPQFIPLMQQTSEDGFSIQEAYGDKAYLSRNNMEFINDLGGVPYIPFKENSTSKAHGSYLWRRMFHYFAYNKRGEVND